VNKTDQEIKSARKFQKEDRQQKTTPLFLSAGFE
jgi:hypothetical protein